MPKKSYDIPVGNAIIDVFSQCDDDFLQQRAIEKGGMNLIDAAASQSLRLFGGCAAAINIGWISRYRSWTGGTGGKAAFVGRVHDDELGAAFCRDINAKRRRICRNPSRKWCTNCLINNSSHTRCGTLMNTF